jgi:integrase
MPSAEFSGPDPVNPLGDDDLGMLAIADLAAEDSRAAFPAHCLASTPGRAYPGWRRSRTQLVALACLPRLASGQSLSAGQG